MTPAIWITGEEDTVELSFMLKDVGTGQNVQKVGYMAPMKLSMVYALLCEVSRNLPHRFFRGYVLHGQR